MLVLGLLGTAIVAVSWWTLPDVFGANRHAELRPATATVIESASCGTSTEGDLVEVRVDGELRRARFDGCGHLPGQELSVRVPADPGQEFVVHPPEDGDADMRERMSRVLLVLSGVAGGGYAMLLRSDRARGDARITVSEWS